MSNGALSRTVFESEAREAFGELVKRYQNAAIAYAYAILRNHAGAEDAAQAAFLTAWLRRTDLREPKAFGSWLRTIVLTECCRIARRTIARPWTVASAGLRKSGRISPATRSWPRV